MKNKIIHNKNVVIKLAIFFTSFISLLSCSNSDNSTINQKEKNDSLLKLKNDSVNFAGISNKEGVVGVFNVPEMLTICKLDSAPMKDVSFKVAKNYAILEEEMNSIKASIYGSPGMILYNNDTSNFIFECVLPIKEFPKTEPKTCKIVVLEASQMLIFNFYGPYNKLFSAYDKIRTYNTTNKLQQSGPMREFYFSDPTIEKDPSKWQTRIMVPVVQLK